MLAVLAQQRVADTFAVSGQSGLLYRRLVSAIRNGEPLPPYEEVALGNLGRFADQVAFVSRDDQGAFKIVRAGQRFEEWLGQSGRDIAVSRLRPDCARPLNEVIEPAFRLQGPAQSVANRVVQGVVETYDLMGLPLASRWGPPIILVFLQERTERYSLVDTIFESTDDGMLALTTIRDEQGRPFDFQIIALNDGAVRLLCRPREMLQWKRLSEIDLSPQEFGILHQFSESLATGKRKSFEVTVPGELAIRHFKVGIAPIGDLLSVTLTDIAEIKAREESFRLLFESNPVPMWLFAPDTLRFLQVNDAAILHYGYTREQFLDMSVLDIRPTEDREAAQLVLENMTDAYQPDEAWRHLKADGMMIEVFPYLRVLVVDGLPAILAAVIDVTERRKAEARIAHMAHHDALTDLPNRVLFRNRLDEALEGVRRQGDGRLAVHCLDLDYFKSVNDTLGHPIGDRLLQAVADRFRWFLRESDTVARLGGDEFAVIQTAIGEPEEASKLAARLTEAISRPYKIDGHQVVIGVSIGIAVAPENGCDPDVLLKNADVALYRAKADGRNTFRFFEHEMDARLQARRLLELDLRKALTAGEFELFYQPLVDLRSNAISGFEALMRWHHPDRGMVSPAEFIPLAEEIGLIVPLGEWLLRQACCEAATWPDHLTIAVNLSPVQFKSRNLVSAVVSALASSGLEPSRLELEITESVLLHDSDANLATLYQFRNLGVRIAMDDFGTGYSSLGYLQKFPFDKIKIDRSFIREIEERPQSRAIVRAVAGLGASLGISTTAEGVETEDQLECLREEGCTEVQGYLFSRPVPASELGPLLIGSRATRSDTGQTNLSTTLPGLQGMELLASQARQVMSS